MCHHWPRLLKTTGVPRNYESEQAFIVYLHDENGDMCIDDATQERQYPLVGLLLDMVPGLRHLEFDEVIDDDVPGH